MKKFVQALSILVVMGLMTPPISMAASDQYWFNQLWSSYMWTKMNADSRNNESYRRAREQLEYDLRIERERQAIETARLKNLENCLNITHRWSAKGYKKEYCYDRFGH